MAREYDHLFKLLIIGDSGKEASTGLLVGLIISHVSRGVVSGACDLYYTLATGGGAPCMHRGASSCAGKTPL